MMEGIASSNNWSGNCEVGCWLSGGSEGDCSRTFLGKQRERLLASVADSSVQSVWNWNCQRTFEKPIVIGRRGGIERALNGNSVSGRQRNWVTDVGSRVTERCY